MFTLVILCLAYKDSHSVKYEISEWLKNMNLLYMDGLLQNFLTGIYFLNYYNNSSLLFKL